MIALAMGHCHGETLLAEVGDADLRLIQGVLTRALGRDVSATPTSDFVIDRAEVCSGAATLRPILDSACENGLALYGNGD